MKEMKCPACGAPVRGQITSRIVACEYCDTQFVLDPDMVDAIEEVQELDEYEEYYYQWDSMAHFAADACSEALNELDDDTFSVSNKIFDGLGMACIAARSPNQPRCSSTGAASPNTTSPTSTTHTSA